MKEVNKTEEKINFILPDFLNYDACAYHLSTCRNHPEIFKDNLNIFGFRGMFPGAKWCEKDKKFDVLQLSEQVLRDYRDKYKSLNTHLFIEFNKEEVKENDYEDEYCNLILDLFNDKRNYVYCKDKNLSNYIKEKYHQINIIGDYDNNLDKFNKLTLVSPEHNRDESIFDNIEYNLMIYPDGGYIRDRRWMFKHTIKDSTLDPINPKKDRYYSKEHGVSFYEMKNKEECNLYLKWEDIEEYKRKGINYFMLSGIGVYNVASVISLVYFIYKEDYKVDAIISLFFLLMDIKQKEIKESF